MSYFPVHVYVAVHTIFGLENVMCGCAKGNAALGQPAALGSWECFLCAFWFDRSVLSKCKIPTKLPFHFGMGSDERAEEKELPCMKTSWPREVLSHHMPCVL